MNDFVDVKGRKHPHTVVIDWDGTCVVAQWPTMGEWLPGAIEALRKMHKAGCRLVIFSARLSPFDPWSSQRRSEAEVMSNVLAVRHKLDTAGLHFVDIWTLPGKPGGSVYIDDRAERYHGKAGSWDKLAQKVLMRLKLETPEVPPFNIQKAESKEYGPECKRLRTEHAIGPVCSCHEGVCAIYVSEEA